MMPIRSQMRIRAARRGGSSGLRCALLLGVSFPGWAACAGGASAQTVAPGFDANQLARNDDGSTGTVTLPFQANFFGTTYSQLYVNNNGNVTFGSASSTFTPTGLGASYTGVPIIAPFFADIDTRNAASGVVAYGNGTYAGRTAFGVTWPNVGYFSSRADRTNTFQLVLTSRADVGAGNFDIYFNYNTIRFETGEASGGTNGLGGTSASAGYSAGTGAAGTFFQIPGSLVNGAFLDGGPNALATGSNNGVLGQFLFPVRNGVVLLANLCQPGDSASTTAVANCGPNQSYNGIFYTPSGQFTLNVLDATTITGPAATDAVLVMPASAGGGATANGVTVNVSASATLRSPDRAGIAVDASAGTGAVTVSSAGRIAAGTAGILAQTGGALTVANAGAIEAPFGILGTGAAATVANSGQIAGATIGIGTSTAGSAITNSGSVTFGLAGLGALANGGPVAITNTGTLTRSADLPTSVSPNIVANLPVFAAALNQAISQGASALGASLGSGSVAPVGIAAVVQEGSLTIGNAGTIDAGPTGIAIAGNLQASRAAAMTVTNAGTLTGASGIFAAVGGAGATLAITNAETGRIVSGSGLAIDTRASTVATQVDNRGGILGAVALSSGSTFTNRGQFVTGGTSAFGGAVNNTGTVALAAGTGQAPASAVLGGVTTFTNGGTIDLRTGSAANTLTIGGNYVGTNGSVLLQASTQAGTSDRLVITGNASGSTGVSVSNLTPGVPFTTGPVLVQVGGTVAANAFTLAGAQNFGTLQAVIVNGTSSAGSTVSIGAVPTASALSGPTAVLASRTIAQQGSSAILDRVQQLRDGKQSAAAAPALPLAYAQNTGYAALVSKDPITPNIVQPPPLDTSVRPAVWTRATGDYERRTGYSNFSFGGAAFSRNLGYEQQTGALLGGADVVISGLTSKEDAVILGVLGGGTLATVNLRDGAGRQDYDGGTVGAYATYLNGPVFVDALLKVDLLGLDIVAPGVRQSTSLQNYSIASNVGYRFALPYGVYAEPTAGLDYVATEFSRNAAMTPSTVPLRDGDALRGRIGVRVGSEAIIGAIRIEPSVTAYAYTVLTESNPSGALNGFTSVTGLRDEGKARGELQAALNVFNLTTGVSGFVRADMRVGSDLLAGGGRVGVRYQW